MLEFKKISYSYNSAELLKDITLRLSEGKTYGMSGPSGVGKSTLCKIATGQLRPTSGQIILDNQDITGTMSQKVLMVSQEPDLFPWQTVEASVEFFGNSQTSLQELLDLVSLTEKRHLYPKQLSGGMKKRLSLCRALSVQPRVLVIDELFSSQDEKLQMDLFTKLVNYTRKTKMILLIVSHDVDFLKAHCDEQLNIC